MGLVCLDVDTKRFSDSVNSAFGGMIAFCIIVGDTIPNVMIALFPALPRTPFLWLLTNRRAVIIIFILGISYPLSLYRDIAKVKLSTSPLDNKHTDTDQLAKASTLALISMLVIIVTVITQDARLSPEYKGSIKGSLLVKSGVFQAVGVISFGKVLLRRYLHKF